MNDSVNRQILLVEKPTGKLAPENFKMSKGSIPEPKDGEALLRVRYISLDAANRAWMHGATYTATNRKRRRTEDFSVLRPFVPRRPAIAGTRRVLACRRPPREKQGRTRRLPAA
jgi:hypothetical protein